MIVPVAAVADTVTASFAFNSFAAKLLELPVNVWSAVKLVAVPGAT